MRARLIPRRHELGHVMLNFGYKDYMFVAGGSAQEIADQDVEYFKAKRNIDGDPRSPLAYQVFDGTEPPLLPWEESPKQKTMVTSADVRSDYVSRADLERIVHEMRAEQSRIVEEAVKAALASVAQATPVAVPEAVVSVEESAPAVQFEPEADPVPAPVPEQPAVEDVEVPSLTPADEAAARESLSKLDRYFPAPAKKRRK